MGITNTTVTIGDYGNGSWGFTFIGGPIGDIDPDPTLIPGENPSLNWDLREITFYAAGDCEMFLESAPAGDSGVEMLQTTLDHITLEYSGGSREFNMIDIGSGGDLHVSFSVFGIDSCSLYFRGANVDNLWTAADDGVDYIVGFDTEPTVSVTEWMRPTTAESRDIDSGVAWDDVENVLSGDASVASVTLVGGETSDALVVQGFDMSSIPIGAVIVGVEAEFVEFTESSGAPGAVWDEVNLVLADDTLGTGDQSGDLLQIDNTLQTSVAGEPLSKWAENQITAAEARDPDFGVAVRILLVSGGTKADLRALRLRFFFEETGPTVRKRPRHLGLVYG